MKAKILFILSLSILSNSVFAQVPQALADSFQLIINNHVSSTNDKGISAAIIMPDGSIWKGVAGDDGSGNPITSSTLFYGASTTKSFVAACVLQLAEEGKLSLTDSIHRYLNGSQYPQNRVDSTINLYQLLTHTSGIYNYTDNPNYYLKTFITNTTKVYTPSEILFTFLTSGSVFPKGSSWKYCNSNYVLLGLIIEAVTGHTLTSEIKTRVIDKIGMPNTFLGDGSTTNTTAGLWANIGLGETNLSNVSHKALLTSFWAAGNIVTLPIELATYCRQLIKGNLYTDSTTIDTMIGVIPASIDLTPGDEYAYGMGLVRVNYNNTYVYGHTGNVGHITRMFHNPTYNYTIVAMTNRFGVFGNDNIKAYTKLEQQVLNYLATTTTTKKVVTENLDIKLLTNAFTNENQLVINSPQSTSVDILICNQLGQVMTTYNYNVIEGANTIALKEFNNYASGLYFIKVQMKSTGSVVKAIK